MSLICTEDLLLSIIYQTSWITCIVLNVCILVIRLFNVTPSQFDNFGY